MKPEAGRILKTEQYEAGRILKTEQTEATETEPALLTLQKSQQMLKDIFLPEILTNK